jgi:hypothetical protein
MHVVHRYGNDLTTTLGAVFRRTVGRTVGRTLVRLLIVGLKPDLQRGLASRAKVRRTELAVGNWSLAHTRCASIWECRSFREGTNIRRAVGWTLVRLLLSG